MKISIPFVIVVTLLAPQAWSHEATGGGDPPGQGVAMTTGGTCR